MLTPGLSEDRRRLAASDRRRRFSQFDSSSHIHPAATADARPIEYGARLSAKVGAASLVRVMAMASAAR